MIKGTVSVENPMKESWARETAMHYMMVNTPAIFDEFRNFMPEADYDERWDFFKQRFHLVKVKPECGYNNDGWYIVARVVFTLSYRENRDFKH